MSKVNTKAYGCEGIINIKRIIETAVISPVGESIMMGIIIIVIVVIIPFETMACIPFSSLIISVIIGILYSVIIPFIIAGLIVSLCIVLFIINPFSIRTRLRAGLTFGLLLSFLFDTPGVCL
ncbi:MAG: hypothetical protein JXR67_04475 [Bacteroidales bacterium]|nr:hypothetical protein [Bacteroidales bacterium]